MNVRTLKAKLAMAIRLTTGAEAAEVGTRAVGSGLITTGTVEGAGFAEMASERTSEASGFAQARQNLRPSAFSRPQSGQSMHHQS
jgi:hypothetical protein